MRISALDRTQAITVVINTVFVFVRTNLFEHRR
jgi:hypothetical protein